MDNTVPAPSAYLPETNPDHTAFYVSAIDGARAALIAGPYSTHQIALDAVRGVKARAEEIEPRAHWWAWGTCSLPEHPETLKPPLGVI